MELPSRASSPLAGRRRTQCSASSVSFSPARHTQSTAFANRPAVEGCENETETQVTRPKPKATQEAEKNGLALRFRSLPRDALGVRRVCRTHIVRGVLTRRFFLVLRRLLAGACLAPLRPSRRPRPRLHSLQTLQRSLRCGKRFALSSRVLPSCFSASLRPATRPSCKAWPRSLQASFSAWASSARN